MSYQDVRGLKMFLKDNRNDLVEKAQQFAKDMCGKMAIPLVKRKNGRKKKLMPGEKG